MRITKTLGAAVALAACCAQAQTPAPPTPMPTPVPPARAPGAPPRDLPPTPRAPAGTGAAEVPQSPALPMAPPKLRPPPPPAEAPPAAPPAPPVDPLAGFGWFVQLAGACWKGEHPDGKTSDVQCYELQFKRFIRGTLKVISTAEGPAKTVFEGDSIYAVDPAGKGKVSYTQWGSTGNFTIGEMNVEGEMLRFQQRLAGGGEARVRFAWRKVDENGFRVSRERKDGGVWKEVFAVVYQRVR